MTSQAGEGRKIPRAKLSKQSRKRRLFRTAMTFVVILTMFSLFGLFLRYITVDHPPKDNAQDMGSPNQ
jgi:hypothetical protein